MRTDQPAGLRLFLHTSSDPKRVAHAEAERLRLQNFKHPYESCPVAPLVKPQWGQVILVDALYPDVTDNRPESDGALCLGAHFWHLCSLRSLRYGKHVADRSEAFAASDAVLSNTPYVLNIYHLIIPAPESSSSFTGKKDLGEHLLFL